MDDDGPAGRREERHDDYFVTVGSNTPLPPARRPGEGPPASRRRLGIGLVLALAMVVALSVTAVLVRAADSGSTEVRPAAQGAPIVEDGFLLWARNDDGSAVRWNPCEPIRWVLNPGGAPLGAQQDVEAAIASIAEASGLQFEFAGTTGEAPGQNRSPYQPDRYGSDVWAPVLVAWASPGPGVPLGERDRAVAIPVAIGDGGTSVFVSGQIVFNRERGLQRGFGDRTTSLGGTAMHELGHLVGLDHVSDPDQLMFPHPHLGPVQWGEGDRRGLATVGDGGGCLDPVPPHPVDVVYAPDFDD